MIQPAVCDGRTRNKLVFMRFWLCYYKIFIILLFPIFLMSIFSDLLNLSENEMRILLNDGSFIIFTV